MFLSALELIGVGHSAIADSGNRQNTLAGIHGYTIFCNNGIPRCIDFYYMFFAKAQNSGLSVQIDLKGACCLFSTCPCVAACRLIILCLKTGLIDNSPFVASCRNLLNFRCVRIRGQIHSNGRGRPVSVAVLNCVTEDILNIFLDVHRLARRGICLQDIAIGTILIQSQIAEVALDLGANIA